MAAPSKKYYDILGHKLVPEHTILSDKEKKELLEKYNIKTDQLPRILANDPAVISTGAKPGQIVKIIRKSPTAKYATAYRLVVESDTSESFIFAESTEEVSTVSEE
ncbi:MAG TPA: DNA-directed RNA polymerase subunit H [Candidatus Thermoplasmatota archaeon]|nr:DNA-directed RNA polymerase subunit H [Candidatus Thermoplasmatota archaeon]